MDSFLLFWLILAILFILLFFGIPYLLFYIFKRFGRKKLGKIIGLSVFLIFSFFTTYVVFEDYFFFNYSATKELELVEVILTDDFTILKNESGGFTDYYHIFELEISENDVRRLIGNRVSESEDIVIKQIDLDINVFKIVSINPNKRILTFEYIIN